MTFRDHFATRAATYSRYRPDYPDTLITFAAGLAPRRTLAWDCATGSGQVAVPLARHFERVIATDASAAQLAQAHTHPRVTYRQATAEESGLAAGSVDLVTVAQALHWLDLDRFYAEVKRVAVPGGALVVWSYDDPELDAPVVDAVLQRFNHETLGAYWPAERRQVGRAYLEYPFPFDEVETPSLVLERLWTLEELTGYLRSWSATARFVAAHGRDPVDEVERELAACWGPADARHRLAWPLTIRAGRV